MATTGQFTVGRDVTAIVIAPNGSRLDLSGLTDFKATPEYKTAKVDRLNGPPLERFLPCGHRLSFSIDRMGPTNELLFTLIEAGWWAVGSADPGTSSGGTVFTYTQEADGSTTIAQYVGVALKLSQAGDNKVDSAVKQTIEGFASQRVL